MRVDAAVVVAAILGLAAVGARPSAPEPFVTARAAPERSSALKWAYILPSDVTFVVRIDAEALAESPLLPRLLEQPEADNPFARVLAAPATLQKISAVYIGFPSGFTPLTRELPVVVEGSFTAREMAASLASARGVTTLRRGGRSLFAADGELGTSYALPLADGVLALGDDGSVLRMAAVRDGEEKGVATSVLDALRGEDGFQHVVGGGRVPVALRGYLQAEVGSLAAPFTVVDRMWFEGSLGRAVDVRASLHPATAQGKQTLEQALGAVRMFGPSRFADDPEMLSAVQSLQFTSRGDEIDVSVTFPRSLLLEML